MLKRAKRFAIVSGVVFVVLSLAIYLATKNAGFVFFLGFLNETLLLVGFWKCPNILFKTVTPKRNRIQVKAKSSKIWADKHIPAENQNERIVSTNFQIRNSKAGFQKYAISSDPKCNLNTVKRFASQTKKNILMFLLSTAGYLATFNIPSTGPATFICGMFMFLTALSTHWHLLLFLVGTLER